MTCIVVHNCVNRGNPNLFIIFLVKNKFKNSHRTLLDLFTMKAPILLGSFSLLVLLSYAYIVSFHRVQDLEDVRAVVVTLTAPSLSTRCLDAGEGQRRCLPNVIMIGASKCGTTSLVDYLGRHDNVSFVNRRIHKVDKHREIHRFDRNTFGMAMKAVELADEWTSSPIVSSENIVVIHYTPHYIYAPTVPYEMKRFYPHASELKFVVMLREPVKRAWSSYWFHNSHLIQGIDKGSVEEFIELANAEMTQRKNYEECMNTQLRSLPFHGSSAVEMESTARTPPGSARLLYLYKLIGHLISLHNITQSGLQIPVQRGMGTSIDLETIERMLYSANKRCFGTHLRSPALGTRHIDKGVYIDQIIRWYASFKPFQFHVGTLESFALAPVERLQDILDFLAVPSAAGSGIGIFGTSTDADTQLTDLRTPISLNKSDVHSRANIGLRKYDALVNQLDFGKKRLERPNKRIPELSSVGEKQLSALYAFYKPYNELLLLFNISL